MWRLSIILSMAGSMAVTGQESVWLRQLSEAKELESQGNYRAARDILLGMEKGTAKQTDASAAIVLNNLGVVTQQLGDFSAAERYYRESLRRLDRAGGANEQLRCVLLNNLV